MRVFEDFSKDSDGCQHLVWQVNVMIIFDNKPAGNELLNTLDFLHTVLMKRGLHGARSVST